LSSLVFYFLGSRRLLVPRVHTRTRCTRALQAASTRTTTIWGAVYPDTLAQALAALCAHSRRPARPRIIIALSLKELCASRNYHNSAPSAVKMGIFGKKDRAPSTPADERPRTTYANSLTLAPSSPTVAPLYERFARTSTAAGSVPSTASVALPSTSAARSGSTYYGGDLPPPPSNLFGQSPGTWQRPQCRPICLTRQ